MGNKSSIEVPEEYVNHLRETTTYTHGEIKHLYGRFKMFSCRRRTLTRRDLFLMPDLQENPINKMIFTALFGHKTHISFIQFAEFIHIFRPLDDDLDAEKRLEFKLRMLFNMYDANSDKRITKAELFDIVHRMYSDELEYYDCTRIVEIMIAEADTTKTNQILFKDFCESISGLPVDRKLMLKIPYA